MPRGRRNVDVWARLTPVSQSSAYSDDASVEQLRAAIAARDEFIAIAAHELRNPMTPIAGQVDLLLQIARRTDAAPQVLKGLERLTVAVDRFVRRASALLEIGRVNSGRLELEPATFDLIGLILPRFGGHPC